MQRNSQPELGRYSPRTASAVALCLVGTGLAMLSFAAPATQAPIAGIATQGPMVIPSEFNGDVKDLPQTVTDIERNAFNSRPEFERPDFGPKPILPGASLETPSPDVSAISAPMPNPSMSFDGMNFNANGAGHPPDTVGDVGPNHFVQAVNTSVGIFDKATGAALATFTFD